VKKCPSSAEFDLADLDFIDTDNVAKDKIDIYATTAKSRYCIPNDVKTGPKGFKLKISKMAEEGKYFTDMETLFDRIWSQVIWSVIQTMGMIYIINKLGRTSIWLFIIIL